MSENKCPGIYGVYCGLPTYGFKLCEDCEDMLIEEEKAIRQDSWKEADDR